MLDGTRRERSHLAHKIQDLQEGESNWNFTLVKHCLCTRHFKKQPRQGYQRAAVQGVWGIANSPACLHDRVCERKYKEINV